MNVVDYDRIVVRVESLNADVLLASDYTLLNRLRGKLGRFVGSGGHLIIVGAPLRASTVARGHNNWDWCPLGVRPVAEEGDTVERPSADFKKLLDHLTHWTFHYDALALTPELSAAFAGSGGGGVRMIVDPIATNRYGGLLAGVITFVHASRTVELPGSVTFLPQVGKIEPHHAVNLVLEDLLGRDQITVSFPPWLDSMQMPVVEPINAKISALQEQIEGLEAELLLQQTTKAEYERFKGLLYVSSFELEKLVAECLQMLGGVIKPARYSQEEFVLEHQGRVLLAECKGVSKSIALTHLRQLTDYLLRYEEDEGAAGKGILFGNAWRELPPDERDTNDQPIFPENVRRRALQLDIALVSMVEFFKAFCAFLEGRVEGAKVLDWLTESIGVAKADSLLVAGR